MRDLIAKLEEVHDGEDLEEFDSVKVRVEAHVWERLPFKSPLQQRVAEKVDA